MGRSRKPQRDVTRLSGKPLQETLQPYGRLSNPTEEWFTSPDLTEYGLPFSIEQVQATTYFLVANPGLNSSVLFRADLLLDSNAETEILERGREVEVKARPARDIPGYELTRTIVRRLIPRNSQLDTPLEQTCHFYLGSLSSSSSADAESSRRQFLVTYTPHVSSVEELPYYHPRLRALAFEYENISAAPLSTQPTDGEPSEQNLKGQGIMSVHFLPYTLSEITTRLERTLSNLLDVQIRLTRRRASEPPATKSPYAPIKDNIIPRHRVQDMYSLLKSKYAVDLCSRWVESTEPSKHVYEDLGVAAFLIELWRDMYGCIPGGEQQQPCDAANDNPKAKDSGKDRESRFPGFVDIACGNGVLVYILLQEGYLGWGFDARRRKTWSIFPDTVQERLKEEIYIPKPFADVLSSSSPFPPSQENNSSSNNFGLPAAIKTHTASHPSFPKSLFIISNHADELTLWTPLLTTLLNPSNPPPFLAIPCCSHSLTGARYRYPPPPPPPPPTASSSTPSVLSPNPDREQDTESTTDTTGSLKTLREEKQSALNPGSTGFNKSAYGCLTEKLMLLAREVGYGVEKTLLRIPSTRNIGVLGRFPMDRDGAEEGEGEVVVASVMEIVRRECERDGGVLGAAREWVERARGLTAGHGHGHGHT
ncbi:hypothetical protein BJX61DRAFT_80147 [Aspergillus egyptiacus]|nr:hypothetical protein BJX61DRAFT_80147 [Aspergillus egyptiacus]